MINKFHYSAFFCVLSATVLPFLSFFFTNPFELETSVWCMNGSNQTNLCKFRNICYDPQFKTFLFFLGKGTVIKGFNHYSELQKIQLSSVQQHNQFYANLSVIDVNNYKLTKELIIYSNTLLLSRFKPNNLMHSIHDDIFPVFLTLEFTCLGDLECMEKYILMFHDNHPVGPFYNLYKLLSKHTPILLNELKLNSNSILCFKEMITGLIRDGVFYQYGFKNPHGPVKSTHLTQNDVFRFTTFVKDKMGIKNKENESSKVIILNRGKNRKILNVNDLKEMTKDAYKRLNKKIEVNVINLDLFSSDLNILLSAISQADGLIGMHGAEMILSLFLKPNSYVFEIFTFGIKPEVVSFIKPVSELTGSNFMYFSWRNMERNNSVPHPDAHPHFGGISHLDEITQNKIKSTCDVPPVKCCNNPLFLYYMYQDTFISHKFRNYLYESLSKVFKQETNSKSEQILKNWFYPYIVYNISCRFNIPERVLHVNWYPPFNAKNNNLWYSLYIQDQKGLFGKEISTEETSIIVEVPVGVNPVFEMWISAHFVNNNFKSPDLYINCY